MRLRAVKHGREVWLHDDDGGCRFQVWYIGPISARRDGAAAAIYGGVGLQGWSPFVAIRVDRWGTEVWPRLVGAPGYWCWLLDQAIEAGFEPAGGG